MRRFFLIILLVTAGGVLRAAEEGETAVVIYNSRLPESKEVADHYAERRQVPAAQVLGLDLTTNEVMSRAEYRDQLETPLLNFLEKGKFFVFEADRRKLEEATIRYAVLCYGVPLRIAEDPGLIEPDEEKLPPILRRNGAAVDSELALLPRPNLMRAGPLRNPLYGATNRGQFNAVNGVLMVARLDGPDASIARGLVDKAMEAETNGLWGRAYFDLRGLTNGTYKKGDDWLGEAANITRHFGFETVMDNNEATFSTAFPMSQIALYAGWYDWNASGPFAQPHVEFMPGAFAYHLQSYSAQSLRTTTKSWCGPLLAKGAAATMGCVDEPYLDGTPNVEIFFARWLQRGFSFGEAAYASQQTLSWQTTVIGDPLYRPFGKNPQLQHQALLERHNPLVEWSHLRVVNLNLDKGASPAAAIQYLTAENITRQSAVLTEKLSDLYQSTGQYEKSMEADRLALKLNPSPLQRVRLTLDLGDKLIAAGKEKEALGLYDNFIRNDPEYPGALPLYQKMETLARKVGKKSQVKAYAAEVKRLTPPLPAPAK